MPRITISRQYPVEVGDDYILEEVSTEMPRLNVCSKVASVMPLRNAKIVLEGIVSERDSILKQVELRQEERKYQTQLDKMRRNRRRELERRGLNKGNNDSDAVEDEGIVKVKVE